MTFPRRILLFITLWTCFVWIQVECNPTGANTNAENDKQGSKETQTAREKVEALGRSANFADIYDATTDNFGSMSISKARIQNEAIRQTNSSHSSIQLIGDEPLKEKMRKLEIQPSQFISLLLDLSDQSEARSYLQQFAPDPRTAKASLVYKIRTVVESYDPYSNASVAKTDRRALEISGQTHAVVGLEYGADLVLTVKKRCTSRASAKEAQKQLEADIQSIIDHVAGDGIDPSSSRSDWRQFGGFDLSADFVFDIVPISISDAVSITKKFPKKLNGEKGMVKGYILEPIENIRASLDIQSNKTSVAKKMDQELIDKLLNIFQELEYSNLLIHDLYEGIINDWAKMLPSNSDERDKISGLKFGFERYERNLKEDLKNRVVGFRRGKVESETIKEVISSYENGNWTAATINHTIANFSQTMKKIDLLNLFRANGASFVGSIDDQLYTILMNDDDKELRFISADLSMDISTPYVQDIVKLLESSNDSDKVEYYIRDVAVPRPTVEVYKDGEKVETIQVGKE